MAMEDGGNDESGRCELLGPFALFIQGALGALALLSLVWKRARESPQRPILVWWFDVSKQVVGSVLVHIANILLSMLSSGTFSTEPTLQSLDAAAPTFARLLRRQVEGDEPDFYHPNPCSFYLLNLAIDTTLGIVILIYLLRLLHALFLLSPIPFFRTGISSGDYGEPPKWSYWGKQSIIYFMGLMGMKLVVWLIFALCPWLGRLGDWMLAWTEGDKRLQVFFVMFFFPLVMNAMQYYIIDSYIKNKNPSHTALQDSAPIPGRRASSTSMRYSFDSSNDVFSSEDEASGSGNLLQPSSNRTHQDLRKMKKSPTPVVEEYNPDTDGSTLQDGLDGTPRSTSPSPTSFLALRNGRKGLGGKGAGVESSKSRNSSMMLLPGSRGPSTPGYGEEESAGRSFGGRRGSDLDDDSTLIGPEDDLERCNR
ncbi:Vaculolar membrane protein-domain-containing protein [Tuber borchii]|uniref:Vaculolar membrane protein-domain-containing protein n=1 Tax=Tuber borchii TaxID=42251 RepID=A0A2T6ZDM8_TUBBO|nr:Vaculolar membrane protein-domain-containing protein [Tuber borchii]